jgi:hypothetical protein
MNYNDDENKIRVWTDEKNSIGECKKGEEARSIGKFLEKRHYKEL